MPKRKAFQALRRPGTSATIIGLAANALLCGLKLVVGFLTSSLALLSDGVNSLTDAISSLGILIAVHVSHKEADPGHPFGHRRAEPIAGLVVAIFAGIAGFEVLKEALIRLYTGRELSIVGYLPFAVLIFSMLVKLGMSFFFRRTGQNLNSPAILASAEDSKVDVLVSATALCGILGVRFGAPILDPLAGLVISLFVFYAGYSIGCENIDYLMGRSPSQDRLNQIRGLASEFGQVGGVDGLRAHYVGNYIHVEVELSVTSEMTPIDTHDLEEAVKAKIEALPWVDRAFIHVNPRRPSCQPA